MLLIYFILVNIMIHSSVPKVHTNHMTIKFTLPVLPITGQFITNIALSLMRIIITMITLPLLLPAPC